ncbi:MAG: hypothetical protein GY796_12850 [Chloroflexi bacterium]|nr:hypothetical protein [Chloroflexota bacterium]
MPYTVGHPVQNPSEFYGRQTQISHFFSNITTSKAQSLHILGLNQSGKTSFLRHVAHPSVTVRHLRHPEKIVMVYVDMSTCKTPAYFYYRVLMQLKMRLGQVNTGFLWQESLPEKTNIYDVEVFLCHFSRRRIVLLLDQFDNLPTDTFGRDFLTELRAMVYVADYDLLLVTASMIPLPDIGCRLGLPATSPFYTMFAAAPICMGELDTAVVDTLISQSAIQEGVPFSTHEVYTIKWLAGTLPYLLQVTAARWLYYKRMGFLPEPEIILSQLIAELTPIFEEWWDTLDAESQRLLGLMTTKYPDPAESYFVSQQKKEHQMRLLGLVVGRERHPVVNGAILETWVSQQFSQPDYTTNGTHEWQTNQTLPMVAEL